MKIISIIERLFIYFQVDTNIKLAEKLGVTATTLSNWKARNTIDYELIITKCEGVNYNWLFMGNGKMLLKECENIDLKYNSAPELIQLIEKKDEQIMKIAEENWKLKADIAALKKESKPASYRNVAEP